MQSRAILLFLSFIMAASFSYSAGYVKLMSDKSGAEVYANGELVGTYIDTPIEFILDDGEYKIEVKKLYDDGSMDYYETQIRVGKIKTITAKIKWRVVTPKLYFQ